MGTTLGAVSPWIFPWSGEESEGSVIEEFSKKPGKHSAQAVSAGEVLAPSLQEAQGTLAQE